MAAPRERAVGVDAAGRHGWVGVVVGADGFDHALVELRLADLIARVDASPGFPVRSIGVDIPIGLVDGPRRAADVAARAFVGPRRSSVFPAPPRSAVDFADQASANAHLAARGLPLLSSQAVGLLPRIRETASVAASDERVIEVFPEASFCAMGGAHLAAPKKVAAGALARLGLLAATEPPIDLVAERVGEAGAVPLDDLFDAAAAAWSAWRRACGRAEPLGDPAERCPDTGRRIAMWV